MNERRPGYDGQPVEHFRPKSKAYRPLPGGVREEDSQRYWWLCWTWENLLFACTTCNGIQHKGNWFPLEGTPMPCPSRPTESPLDGSLFDTGTESPMLLDPTDGSDPLDHLQWAPVDRKLPRPEWIWELSGSTPRGKTTIDFLGLEKLTDDVREHYRATVWPRFKNEVDDEAEVPKKASSGWYGLCEAIVRPQATFAAATWWMLEALRRSTPQLRELQLDSPPRFPTPQRPCRPPR